MTIKQDALKGLIDETRICLQELTEAIDLAKSRGNEPAELALFYDGARKRFENLFVQTYRLLGLALTAEGIDILSPRGAIQEAVRLGWITNPDFWLLALDTRMRSIQNSPDIAKREFLNLGTQFATEVEVIMNLLYELEV